MILKRRKARDRRIEKGALIAEWRRDLKGEIEFESVLERKARRDGMRMEKIYQPHMRAWGEHFPFRLDE
jgi:hypothetical protein